MSIALGFSIGLSNPLLQTGLGIEGEDRLSIGGIERH